MDAVKKPFIAAVSGIKNSGKTTFLEKLVKELTERNYKVAVIKHDGHEFQPDREGTDTYRMQHAGAYGTCIFSRGQWQMLKKEPDMDVERLAQFFPEADFILVEGMKNSLYPKFEMIRGSVSKESVCIPETILALVTDTEQKLPGISVLGLDEIKKAADILEKLAETNKKTGEI